MSRSEAGAILRRHVILRRMRSSVRSINPEAASEARGPRLAEVDFEESCALVRGVPEWTLGMLEVWVCDSPGATWTVDAVQIRGRMENIPVEQVAMRYTLSQAAHVMGVALNFKQARALYSEAMSIVTDNLIARAGSELQTVVR